MANRAGSGQALDDSLPTVFAEFKLLRQESGIQRSTATHMRLKPHTGTAVNVNNYDRVTGYDVADAADIAQAQDLADTTTSYTPGEVAVQVILPGSTMRRVADPDLFGRTGRMMSNAYDLKEDQDGCDQLTSFTPIVGSAGTVMSPGHAAAIGGRLRIGNVRRTATTEAEPAPKPWYLVINPMSGVPLEGRLVPYTDVPTGTTAYGANTGAHGGTTLGHGGGSSMTEDIVKRGLGAVGQIAGMTLKYNANINVDGSDDASGAGYSQEGYIYVSEVAAHPDHDRSDKSMRGAVELNIWGSYVWGLYRASNYGVECLVDASIPTS
jgi:hypothetical protein